MRRARAISRPKLREFPVAAVYTLATGLIFGDFDDVHGAIEYLLGSPVWTHQLALVPLWDTVKAEVARQYPPLAAMELEPRPPVEDKEALNAWGERQVKAMEALIGAKRLPLTPLPEGAWNPLHPLDGIPDHVTPILVEVDPDSGPEGAAHAAEQIKGIIERMQEEEP